MKKAVVFYSFDGNTRAIAKAIAGKLNADVFELTEVKKRPEGMKAFMSSGFQAFFGLKTALENYFEKELGGCDMIYIGSPVWAGKTTPAVNGFISKVDAKGKKFVVFTVQAGKVESEPTRGAVKMTAKLMANGANEVKQLAFRGTDIGKCISSEEAKKKVSEVI